MCDAATTQLAGDGGSREGPKFTAHGYLVSCGLLRRLFPWWIEWPMGGEAVCGLMWEGAFGLKGDARHCADRFPAALIAAQGDAPDD
jgi:hypothetical protein